MTNGKRFPEQVTEKISEWIGEKVALILGYRVSEDGDTIPMNLSGILTYVSPEGEGIFINNYSFVFSDSIRVITNLDRLPKSKIRVTPEQLANELYMLLYDHVEFEDQPEADKERLIAIAGELLGKFSITAPPQILSDLGDIEKGDEKS